MSSEMDWSGWLGRSEARHDQLTGGLVARWCATLDRPLPTDESVPQGLHWCLCLPDTPTGGLGEDGHPLRIDDRAGFLPPIPLPRRMWAASSLEFLQPLRQAAIDRRSSIKSIAAKSGQSGALVFLDLVHETICGGSIAVRETQSIVYREAATGAPAPNRMPAGGGFDAGEWHAVRTIVPEERLLFRFSALTFNAHRIHYDLPYATQEEGYAGLVVHGPLTATLLLELFRRELGENHLSHFRFRAVSPAFAGETMHLVFRSVEGRGFEGRALTSDGRTIVEANAIAHLAI